MTKSTIKKSILQAFPLLTLCIFVYFYFMLKLILPSDSSAYNKTQAVFIHPAPRDPVCNISSAVLLHTNVRTALASYPRSGNTWTRSLIEKATGYLTSSIYCDRSLVKTFPAECNMRNKFLMKTHYPSVRNKVDKFIYDRAIVVVRNPFDAIYSFYNYLMTKSHTIKLNRTELFESEFNITLLLDSYVRHYETWKNKSIEKIVIRYEDLKKDTFTNLKVMSEFLVGPVSNERVYCAIKEQVAAYNSSTSTEPPFYSLKLYTLRNVEKILQSAGLIFCELQYDVPLYKWLNEVDLAGDQEFSQIKEKLGAFSCNYINDQSI